MTLDTYMTPNNFNTLAKNYAAGSILEENLKGSQVSNSILLHYFNQRTVIEKEYCEKLKNLSKIFKDDAVIGRVKDIFEITKNQLLSISDIKSNIFNLINNQYEKSFAELSFQQNEEFQKYYETITDERTRLISAHNEKEENFKEYSVIKNEIIDLINEYKKTYEDSISKKIEDAFDREKKLRIKYIYAKDKYDKEKRTCMNNHNETSESFRYLERERTEFIIKHLTNYINNLIIMNRKEFESYNILINNLNTIYSSNDNLNELLQFSDLLNNKDENSVEQVNKEIEKLQTEYKNEKKLKKFRKGKKKQNILHVQNVTETENESEPSEKNEESTTEILKNQESPSEEIITTESINEPQNPELLTIHEKRNTINSDIVSNRSSGLINFDDLIETMQNFDRTLDRSDQVSLVSKNTIQKNGDSNSSNKVENNVDKEKENNNVQITSDADKEEQNASVSDNLNNKNAIDNVNSTTTTENTINDNKQNNNNDNTIINNNTNSNTNVNTIDSVNAKNTDSNSNANQIADSRNESNLNNNLMNFRTHEHQLQNRMSNDNSNSSIMLNNANNSFINKINSSRILENSYSSISNIDTSRVDIVGNTNYSKMMISPSQSPQNNIYSSTNNIPTQNLNQYQRRNMPSFSSKSSPNLMVKRNSNDSNKTTGSIKSNHSRSSIGSMISSIFQSQSSHKISDDRRSINSEIVNSTSSTNIPSTPRRLSSKQATRSRPQSGIYYPNSQSEKPLSRQRYYKPPSNSRHESLCCTLKRNECKNSLREGYYTPQLRESHYSSMQTTNSPLISSKSSFISNRSPSIPYIDINTSIFQDNQSISEIDKSGKRINSMRSNTSLSTVISTPKTRSSSEISMQQKMHSNKNIPNTLNYNYDPYDISIVKPILFYVRVLFDYNSAIYEEISVRKDMIIPILETQEDGWWEGEIEEVGPTGRRRRRGLLPSNFVEVIKNI